MESIEILLFVMVMNAFDGNDYVVTPKRLSMNFDAPWWSASHSMSEMLPRNKISLYSIQKSLDCGVDNRNSNATCISC